MKARSNAGRRLVVAGCIAAVAAAVLAVAHHVLDTRATRILRAHVLPSVEKQLGRRVELEHARLHLFSGRMQLHGLRIANPPGFTPPELAVIDTTHLNIRLLPLLRGTLDITSLAVTNARVTIVRNAEGELNVAPPPASGQAERSSAPPSSDPSDAAASKDESPRPPEDTTGETVLRNLSANVLLSYLDPAAPHGPLELKLTLVVEGHNLGGGPDTPWGTLAIRGHLQDNPRAFVTALQTDIAPFTTPEHAAFDLEGSIRQIRLSDLGTAADDWDVACTSADLLVDASCRDGVYRKDSEVTLLLHEPRLTGRLARHARNLSLPDPLKIPVPLRGRADNPRLDVETALVQTVLGNLAGTLGTMLEETTIDGKKLDGDLGEAAKKLGEILKNW